ncbi:MAG: Colicin immunity protein / pyocin immunity protein [Marinobacter excellens HL-55]|uniref:Colicin immunity protein / pyocin immunity protein n=1 Tax=Marinobacter excellens HL-55 TaxID=1305731 RepID=A0A0P8BE21_9GAMM|nr:MAG: Colicin immunity protein / pyocin immunity protein [Marinobacter excellens HL-55]
MVEEGAWGIRSGVRLICSRSLIKKLLSDYSEEEFMAALNWFWNEDVSEDEENEFVDRFNELVEHPAKSDLIFFPETNREDSPLGVVNEIKRWYREQGKICFRE